MMYISQYINQYINTTDIMSIKIILIGNSGVGKSSILQRYVCDTFDSHSDSTICIEYGQKTIKINKLTYSLNIWDTAGQERYRSVIQGYYRNVDGVLLCFDPTNEQSFKDLDKWINEFKNISDNVNIILVSTKMDIQDKDKIITQNQSRTYANNRKLKFMNVSAKNNINIEECFNYLISKMALLDRQQENNIKLKEKTYVQNMNMCKC